jgi:hypothetical protein
MNILSKFEGNYQLAEQDGRFYYVYVHRPETCGYCIKLAERNDPNEINWHAGRASRQEILKELTAETLHTAIFADATETLDFKNYDLRYLFSDDAEMEEYCEESQRLAAEQETDDRTFSVNGKNVPTSGTED